VSLAIYLKTFSQNVDWASRITLPKSDLRFDRWIFVDHDFSMKIQKKKKIEERLLFLK
jgi:hypothetical protein